MGPLKEALNHGAGGVLYEAEMALGNIEHVDALDTLQKALLDRIGKEQKEREVFDQLRHEVR